MKINLQDEATTRGGAVPVRRRAFLTGTGRFVLLGILLGAVLVDPACNSPFIPIPPPADPTFDPVMVPDGMGGMKVAWQVRGGAAPRAKVFVFNDSLRVGVIALAAADGSYLTGLLDGAVGDRVEISYESADTMEKSPVLCRLLTQGTTSSMQACP